MLKLFGLMTENIEALIIFVQNQTSGKEKLISNTDIMDNIKKSFLHNII